MRFRGPIPVQVPVRHPFPLLLTVLALVLALAAGPAQSAPPEFPAARCGSGRAHGQSFRWCSHVPQNPRPSTVLYYLHGNGGSENDAPPPGITALEAEVKKKKGALPLVLTISFGPTWFLGTQAGMFSPGLLPAFLAAGREAERALSLPTPRERWVYGASMGGFNALELYFHRPGAFARVVALCPALLPFSPFVSQAVIDAFVARHAPYVVPKLVNKWREKLAGTYSSQTVWEAHDPLLLAGNTLPGAPLWLAAQGRDAFAFHEATASLEKILRERGAEVTWQFHPSGGHCEFNPATLDSLANFLAR